MNLLKFLSLFLLNSAEDIKEKLEDTAVSTRKEVRESLIHTKRVLLLGFLMIVCGLVVGITLGFVGYKTKNDSVISLARIVISLGGLLTSVLFAWFWARTLAAGYLLIGLSKIGHLFWQKTPEISRAEAEKFLAWLRGILLWILLAYTYAVLFPVWENLGLYFLALFMMVIATFMIGAWNLDVTAMRRPLAFGVTVVLVYTAVAIMAPSLVARVRNAGSFYSSAAVEIGQRREQLGAAERQAAFAQVQDEQQLLANWREEQRLIRKRAAEDCGGTFCSKADRDRHADIDASIVLLKKGEYWQRANVKGEPPKAVQAEASGTDADAAPPEVSPVEVHKPVGKAKTTARAAASPEQPSEKVPTWKELDAELAQYADH